VESRFSFLCGGNVSCFYVKLYEEDREWDQMFLFTWGICFLFCVKLFSGFNENPFKKKKKKKTIFFFHFNY
jgi:hypothetical protein